MFSTHDIILTVQNINWEPTKYKMLCWVLGYLDQNQTWICHQRGSLQSRKDYKLYTGNWIKEKRLIQQKGSWKKIRLFSDPGTRKRKEDKASGRGNSMIKGTFAESKFLAKMKSVWVTVMRNTFLNTGLDSILKRQDFKSEKYGHHSLGRS